MGYHRRDASFGAVPGRGCGGVVAPARGWFFVRVNQVLVRLWARCVACLTGGYGCPQRERRSEAMCVHVPGLDPGMLSESDPCGIIHDMSWR